MFNPLTRQIKNSRKCVIKFIVVPQFNSQKVRKANRIQVLGAIIKSLHSNSIIAVEILCRCFFFVTFFFLPFVGLKKAIYVFIIIFLSSPASTLRCDL